MGGFGSGYQGMKKAAVEDGLTLCVNDLFRKRALVPGLLTSGGWNWSYPGREPHARISFVGDMRYPGMAMIRLIYTTDDKPVDYVIRLVSTSPYFGGKRWWFLCPIVRRDGRPPHRVAKLHLPRGALYFGSRRAYGLTYKSCRESGQFRALYGRIAAEIGTDPATVRAALKRKIA